MAAKVLKAAGAFQTFFFLRFVSKKTAFSEGTEEQLKCRHLVWHQIDLHEHTPGECYTKSSPKLEVAKNIE